MPLALNYASPSRNLRAWRFVLIVCVVAIGIFALTYLVTRPPKCEGKRLLLDWNDVASNITFRVTESPGAIVKQNSRLHVERQGLNDVVMIDDDAVFSTIAFVQFDHWLLVVRSGLDEVWAGYDYDTGKLYGAYDWDKLPLAKSTGQGKVVAKQKLRSYGYSPANFPRSTATEKKPV